MAQEMRVATLPIFPAEDPPFERMISPVVTCVIANLFRVQPTFLLNLTGCRVKDTWKKPDDGVRAFRNQWQYFCDSGRDWNMIADHTCGYAEFIGCLIRDSRNVTEGDTLISTCDCGKTEIPTAAVPLAPFSARSMLTVDGSLICCRSCRGVLQSSRKKVLSTLTKNAQIPNIIPGTYQTEAVKLWETICSRPHIVSRVGQKDDGRPLVDGYSIDPDVWWSLMPALGLNFDTPLVLVVSHASLVHSLRTAALLSSWYGLRNITIVVHSVVSVVNQGTDLKRMPLSGYRSLAGDSFVARAFPLLGLGWRSGASNLCSSELRLVMQSRHPWQPVSSAQPVQLNDVPNIINRQVLLDLLKNRRSKMVSSDSRVSLLDGALSQTW